MNLDKENRVADHYTVEGLGEKILDALGQSGLDVQDLKPADLSPVDEFHMGGRAATAHVIGLMGLSPGARVLDVGSGLGGAARYLAAECDCTVTGVDLTPEFVNVARMLSDLTGLGDRTEFHVGSALDMPWPDASFDAATNIHVAMNIADRPRLYGEVARVLRPGGVFAIYDAMKGPAEGVLFPVPWAEMPENSFLVTPAEMRQLLGEAGFEVTYEEDRRENALAHHRTRLADNTAAEGPSPLGLHLLTGKTAAQKSRNMIKMLEADQIAPVVMIARRAD